MAKVITEDMFDDIVSSGPMQFFKHTEDKGAVEIVFTSSITHTEPGDEDMFGRIWNPPITDANGMPIIDPATNKPREAWPKTEATCTINGMPHVYSFSAKSLLREFIAALRQEGITNDDLPGTKWSINRAGRWNWVIKYLGKEDIDEDNTSSSSSKKDEKEESPKKEESGDEVKDALVNFKKTNPQKVEAGLNKNSLIQYICFETDLKPTQVQGKLTSLIESGFLSIRDDGLITIN